MPKRLSVRKKGVKKKASITKKRKVKAPYRKKRRIA